MNESPLMTWGEVENTPLRVEGSESPYVDRTPGPTFKVRCASKSQSGALCECLRMSCLALSTDTALVQKRAFW